MYDLTALCGDNPCSFCEEIVDEQTPAEIRRLVSGSRIVAENKTAVALASLSPIAEGHLLLLPRVHLTSLAQMRGDISGLLDLLEEIEAGPLQRFADLLVWEHGIGQGKVGGCGVSHAHLHVVPALAKVQENLLGRLTNRLSLPVDLPSLKDLPGLVSLDTTYLVVRSNGRFSLFVTDLIPSQIVRKEIAHLAGESHWDWKMNLNQDMFVRTAGSAR